LTHVLLRDNIAIWGDNMTAKEFKRKLQANGWKIKQGRRHEIAIHPEKPEVQIAIHRHTGDIPTGTINRMLKDAGLK